ncbi:MAG TPA: hypothetical protein DD379_09635 [Cyanobacteria bacterium UBA11162]|nr:hypothetical protein [Cyanobacteria bacterium UBA11162]
MKPKNIEPQKNNCKKFLTALAVGAAIAAIPTIARADGFDDSIQKITTMSTTLAGLTVLFTEVVVTPMGFSAASQTFRHVVLKNV